MADEEREVDQRTEKERWLSANPGKSEWHYDALKRQIANGAPASLLVVPPPRVYVPYPRAKYHPVLPPVTVQSEEEERGLGPDWLDAPPPPRQEDRDPLTVLRERVVEVEADRARLRARVDDLERAAAARRLDDAEGSPAPRKR